MQRVLLFGDVEDPAEVAPDDVTVCESVYGHALVALDDCDVVYVDGWHRDAIHVVMSARNRGVRAVMVGGPWTAGACGSEPA